MAYNHQGQRVGRPHVAAWAETETAQGEHISFRSRRRRTLHPDQRAFPSPNSPRLAQSTAAASS